MNKQENVELYQLIDRLQKHSEWKYPERKWTNEFYYECAFQWMNKIDELKNKVLKLEEEMNFSKQLSKMNKKNISKTEL